MKTRSENPLQGVEQDGPKRQDWCPYCLNSLPHHKVGCPESDATQGDMCEAYTQFERGYQYPDMKTNDPHPSFFLGRRIRIWVDRLQAKVLGYIDPHEKDS